MWVHGGFLFITDRHWIIRLSPKAYKAQLLLLICSIAVAKMYAYNSSSQTQKINICLDGTHFHNV